MLFRSAGKSEEVTGSHNITVKTDRFLDDISTDDYDALILPGGMPGSTNLRDDEKVISLVKEMNNKGKLVAASVGASAFLWG